jgi:hypothetical protein
MSNEWFENGELPPVGFNVQIALDYEFNNLFPDLYAELNGEQAEIIANRKSMYGDEDVAVFECMIDGQPRYHALVAECFRPIKSEREKAIEAAMAAISLHASCEFQDSLYGRLFDAGLLRLPEDK